MVLLLLQIIRVLVVFGVGAIIGDGVLTPAISVLSSIEGLHEVASISQGEHLHCEVWWTWHLHPSVNLSAVPTIIHKLL